MKTLLAVALLAASTLAAADTYVNGYVRRDGTYVEPHYRSDANSNKYDNYSSQGNSNPYTGQRGYERNEYSNPPSYNQPSNNYNNYNSYDYNRR